MSKVTEIGMYDDLYVNTSDGFSMRAEWNDTEHGLQALAVKINELIAAFNNHIETCHKGIHMTPPKSPNPSPARGLIEAAEGLEKLKGGHAGRIDVNPRSHTYGDN